MSTTFDIGLTRAIRRARGGWLVQFSIGDWWIVTTRGWRPVGKQDRFRVAELISLGLRLAA